jgi:hypothetical protein
MSLGKLKNPRALPYLEKLIDSQPSKYEIESSDAYVILNNQNSFNIEQIQGATMRVSFATENEIHCAINQLIK